MQLANLNLVEIRPLAAPIQQSPFAGTLAAGVRSPHLPPPTDGYAGSSPAPIGPPAAPPIAAEAPPAGMSRARRLALAGLTALSLGGGVFGGLAAHHAGGLSQLVGVEDAWQKLSVPQMVDRMIDAGRNGREVPENLRQGVHARLDALPPEVVRAVAAHGTKIAIMRDSETPVEVGVIKQLPTDRFVDVDHLASIAERAFSEVGGKHAPRIAALEARLEALKASARERYAKHPDQVQEPQGLSGMVAAMQLGGDVASHDPAVQKAAVELAKAKGERAGEVWRTISRQSGQRLEAFSIQGSPIQVAAVMSMMPFSVEGIASTHGARTPQEVQQFADLMVKINGSRLTKAQDQYEAQARATLQAARATAAERLGSGAAAPGMGGLAGGMMGGMMGGLPNPTGQPLTVTQRPFMPAESDVVVPSLYFYRASGDASKKPLVVDGHDARSLMAWASGQTAGQYWYQPDHKTIVLKEKEVLQDTPEMSTTVHEFGHAYQDALEARDPAFYNGFSAKWDEAFAANTDAMRTGEMRFPSAYAGSNSGEFFAEEFSAHFGTSRPALEARDPRGASLLKEALDDAPAAAHKQSPWR